jgi:hypothetical protein
MKKGFEDYFSNRQRTEVLGERLGCPVNDLGTAFIKIY